MDRQALRQIAEIFNDAQEFRIAQSNVMRSGTVDNELMEAYGASIAELEKLAQKMLVGTYKSQVPKTLRQWQQDTPGIGEHLLARLVGCIGHPRIAEPYHWEVPKRKRKATSEDAPQPKRTLVADEPYERTVGQLWQYCGHGAPGRRIRGMTQDDALDLGSPRAKMITHLIAECSIKEPGRSIREIIEIEAGKRRRKPWSSDAGWPYRRVYEERRVNETRGKVHAAPCVRCGPSGKPAAEGTPWSDAHQHADALRIVGKEILRDLWVVAA